MAMIDDIDPYQHLMELEESLNVLAQELNHLAELHRYQSQLIEQITNYFRPIAFRLDTQQVELNQLHQRLRKIEELYE